VSQVQGLYKIVADGSFPGLQTKYAPISIHWPRGIKAPDSVHFGPTILGSTRRRRVLLQATESDDVFTVVGVKSESDCVKASHDNQNANTHWIDIEFSPQRIGNVESQMIVDTTFPSNSAVVIKVDGSGM